MVRALVRETFYAQCKAWAACSEVLLYGLGTGGLGTVLEVLERFWSFELLSTYTLEQFMVHYRQTYRSRSHQWGIVPKETVRVVDSIRRRSEKG